MYSTDCCCNRAAAEAGCRPLNFRLPARVWAPLFVLPPPPQQLCCWHGRRLSRGAACRSSGVAAPGSFGVCVCVCVCVCVRAGEVARARVRVRIATTSYSQFAGLLQANLRQRSGMTAAAQRHDDSCVRKQQHGATAATPFRSEGDANIDAI